MQDQPIEILSHILSFVPIIDIRHSLIVCKRWNRSILSTPKWIEYKYILEEDINIAIIIAINKTILFKEKNY